MTAERNLTGGGGGKRKGSAKEAIFYRLDNDIFLFSTRYIVKNLNLDQVKNEVNFSDYSNISVF